METRKKIIMEILLISIIIVLSFFIINKSLIILNSSNTAGISQVQSLSGVTANLTATFNTMLIPLIHAITNGGSSSIFSLVEKNEYISSSSETFFKNNIWYNEKFYPGNISYNSTDDVYSCSAVNKIIAPHMCFNLLSFFSCGGGPENANFTNLVGYIGFPEGDSAFPNSGATNYSNLYSATDFNSTQNVYQLPSTSFPYQNFINWTDSTIHSYSSTLSGYIYAINTSFTGYNNIGISGSVPKSTLIIPAVSCGSTFINNYVTYPGFIGTLYNISTLSGFTPSVFLASLDENGFGAYYSYGHLISSVSIPWTGSFNSLLAYQIQSISPAFNYTMPLSDYAQFPKGNKGDIQYLNVSSTFSTPLTMSYYKSGNDSNVYIYVSNKSIATIVNVTSTKQTCEEMGPHGSCLRYGPELTTATSADTFTDPDLEGVYYPNYANGVYLEFRTDGIFPICAWNSTTDNTLTACTFEDSNTINNVSYERLWLSNNIKKNQLYDQAVSPGYSSSTPLNNFTLTALDSFCFYGEDFNTNTGVYTSPSYTRIIPPLAQENYTSAIGTCNAFFNNTNCFSSSASQYLNFEDGIFTRDIACTDTGIHAQNVTDAWISSVYVANNAGDYCGDFLGQKNPSDPLANSTLFLQSLSENCPSFNANSSSVNLVVNVKNVGNSNITNPYIVALYGNDNISTIFYNSQGNTQEVNYEMYEGFLSGMSATTGVIQVDYNNNFDTDMYIFDKGNSLNPIPIQSLFSSTSEYENGPFNNSLLGMWIYNQGNNVIRTSNVVLAHSDSGSSGVPVITPNGTATFTIEVPMSLFEALLSGKYNLSLFFGNTFNVTWNGSSTPTSTFSAPGSTITVDPLVSSSNSNGSQTHNNEIITSGSGAPSPIWQYIVSSTLNLSKSPFSGIGVYTDNVSIQVSSVNSTSSGLNVTVTPSVSVLNGTGSYTLGLNQLKNSSISCFASPDNVQDFGVFWSKQIVSPSNLDYALSDIYSGDETQASSVLITKWTGMLFMPYSDQVALNYNNLPHYYPSTASFEIEKPTLNQTSGNFNFEAFDYFGKDSENDLFKDLSNTYNSLNSSVVSFPVDLPNSSLAFNFISNTLVSDPSILRVVGSDTLVNYSSFSNKSFTFSLITSGTKECSLSENTSSNQTFEYTYSGSNCLSKAVVNHSYINISSKYGPFFVDMYNNSNLNLSNETQGGTTLMAANETLSKPGKDGLFMVTLPINTSVNNGISFVFSVVSLSRLLYNSDLYLYYLNDTPFNCNIVNDYNNTGNLDVSKISNGEYYLPNGTIMCNLSSDFTNIRAVFVNKSNNAYLGSGDIESGLSLMNVSNSSKEDLLNISIDGAPVNAQDLYLAFDRSSCDLNDTVVYNGILSYPVGCNLSYALLSFDYNDNGSLLPEALIISPKNYNRKEGQFLYLGATAVSDFPVEEYNLSLPNKVGGIEPIQFVLDNNFGGCSNIRVVTQSPYPYAEVPYQVVSSSSSSCDYEFVGSVGLPYSVFESDSPSVTYPDNWISYNATQYNVQVSTSLFSGDLLSNCASGFGPCIDSFSLDGSNLGNLLFNNVSTSSASIYESLSGPVEDCFTVSYSSSQTVEFPETGFGSINYQNNKLYQTATPSQSISSMYCFYNGAPIITDFISAQGSPITFSVQNQLISNFSYLEDNRLQSFYVPHSIDVGYSKYGKVNVSSIAIGYYNTTYFDNIFTKCENYTVTSPNLTNLNTGINISSSNILTNEKLYCIYNGTPSFTSQIPPSSVNNANSTTSIGFAYIPGNYTDGVGTLYDSCTVPSDLQISASSQFYVSGSLSPYKSSNSGESYIMDHSANDSGLEVLYSPNDSVFIDSCPTNSTILSYSACTKPVNIIPSNGSYSSLEALPSKGNLGGGCFIGTLNGISYQCAPTDGALSYQVSLKSASATSVSVSKVIRNSTDAPTSMFSISFDCSISASNSTFTKLGSCSYPNSDNSGICSANVSYSKINSTAYNITAECSAVSSKSFSITSATTNISSVNFGASQSEKTGLISDYICGNETDIIRNNTVNGWNWAPYSTAGTINSAPSTNPNGVAEVGGCEAGRESFSVENPTINTTMPKDENGTFYQTYSCDSGYTGTIMSCSGKTSLSLYSLNLNANKACSSINVTLINTSLQSHSVSGNGNGGEATSCNTFISKPGYSVPLTTDDCISYHNPVINSTDASYEIQYMNTSEYGIGLGILESTNPLNVSIPNSKQQNSIKDEYMTSLSVSQIENGNNILTDLLPTSLLESNLPSKALSISAVYSYDMLNILMLQNHYFGVSGIPGFINGSILDYALSIFTGGTSGNCVEPYTVSGDGIFKLGEGELCSGKTLPASYKEGVFLSLGTLNEGLHSIQFYSVGNSTNSAQPSVNVFDSVGDAVDLNSACSNGNQRVFTSTYKGGVWSFNITSDQDCNPINNQLYGYIVNCIYQTPGNETYTITSQYYLAYNLPTIWNISYSLLVAPKSYEVVPTPVYQINYSTGSILTLQQPNKTIFKETGLPVNYTWSVNYDKVARSSSSNTIYFYSTGTNSFIIPVLSNHSATSDCYTTYTPSPSNGEAISGTETYIQFTGNTTCYTYFKQTGLPSGLNWNVTYDGITGSTSQPKPTTANTGGSAVSSSNSVIEFITNVEGGFGGNFSYYVPNIKTTSAACTSVYEPNPSFGYILAGTNESITFSLSSYTCVTTFTESGLSKGHLWNVDYNGTTRTSTSNIEFTTGQGSLSYIVSAPSNSSNGCTESYTATPSSGSLTAGQSLSISFSHSIYCITTFTESGLPSGYKWQVKFDGNTKSSTGSTITFNTSEGSFSWSASAASSSSSGCTTTYSSKSGTDNAGKSVSVSFSSSISCTTTFSQSGGSGLKWGVTYDGITEYASGGNSITISTPPGSYKATASIPGYNCSTNSATVSAGSSFSFNSWSCTTNFYLSSSTPLPSSNYIEGVKYNGNLQTQNWGNNRVTLPSGATGLDFNYSSLSNPGTSYSWSVNSSMSGIFDCDYGFGYYVWTANESSGSIHPGQSVYVHYSVACVFDLS